MNRVKECDILVIGTGVAGAAAAYKAASEGKSVIVISKEDDFEESATKYAQGGIVGVGQDDSADLLAKDIYHAGAGASFDEAVEIISNEGPQLVEDILVKAMEVDFDRNEDGELRRTAEAAHSRRRIYHYKDATGLAIAAAMVKSLNACKEVELINRAVAIDLITSAHNWTDRASQHHPNRCLGAYVFLEKEDAVFSILAKQTILATGGLGQVYLHTTNPACATGDGIAMAYRTGARIINSEFVQFHPTAFFHRDCERFLITEAVRGEGGRLLNYAGERFMEKYSPDELELAPRDVVARSIYQEMARTGKSCVFLNIADFAPEGMDVRERFPTIYEKLLKFDIDITKKPIPVVPAAHYSCGGVMVDLEGKTELPGLLAAGEVSCTGIHGANRLASTSLLEGLLWGYKAGNSAAGGCSGLAAPKPASIPLWDDDNLDEISDPLLISQDILTIKTTMWNYAGIARTKKRLERAAADMDYLTRRTEQFYREAKLNKSLIELRNLVTVARIVIRAALRNKESQGCHYRLD